MNTKSLIAIFGICAAGISIGAPIFSAMNDCPSIRTALDDDRVYVDFSSEVRLRLTPDRSEGEVALRGNSGFDANETIQRNIGDGEALKVSALDSVTKKPVVEVFTKSANSNLDFVAVYHRENSAIVVSSFNGEAPRCERLANSAAAEFVSDLAHDANASSTNLVFASSDQVYARLGL